MLEWPATSSGLGVVLKTTFCEREIEIEERHISNMFLKTTFLFFIRNAHATFKDT